MKPKFWCGDVQKNDDFGVEIVNVFYDGMTTLGPWGFMAPASFKKFGVGSGWELAENSGVNPMVHDLVVAAFQLLAVGFVLGCVVSLDIVFKEKTA
jgi:hypothetical protein